MNNSLITGCYDAVFTLAYSVGRIEKQVGNRHLLDYMNDFGAVVGSD